MPARSDCVSVEEQGEYLQLRYEQDEFRFPLADTVLLPIAHTSVEELSQYLTAELERELGEASIARCRWIEVGVEETSGQSATFRRDYG